MLKIAHLTFSSPLVLAPLAGYTDLPFRLLCREYGAGYCVSEMISCHGLCYRQPKTLDMLQSVPEERPVAFQLFGADPERMTEAAAIISSRQPDMIDINMGCPVKKVTKKGAGAALLADPKRAERIIAGIVRQTALPVTVKIRTGINAAELNGVEFARMAEGAGAAAVIVHGRTWAQGFSGTVDREMIARIKRSLSIPVIGNGDIHTFGEAKRMMEDTGCDGVMIGRAALGNPWIFSQQDRPAGHLALLEGAIRHLQLMERYLPTDRMIGVVKSHLGKYFKHLPGSSETRRAIYQCPSTRDLQQLLTGLQARFCQDGADFPSRKLPV